MAPGQRGSHTTHTYRLFSCSCAVFRDSTAHGPSPSHPSTRGTTGIPLSGPVEGSELEFLYASRKTHQAIRDCRHLCRSPPLFAVLLAHQKSSCRCTGLVFHSGAPRRFAKKLVQLRPWSSTMRVQVPGRFPCLGVFKVENGNLKSTIQTAPVISLLEATAALRKHLEATQHSEIVDFLPCLELRRWTAKSTGCSSWKLVPLTAEASPAPFVVWFPACVVQDRTLRKVVASVRSTDVSVTCAR